jgi:two-component system, sensor histidine kinase and response regulator
MRLQHRLSLAILPAILGPLIVIGAISYRQLHQTSQQKALESLRTAAERLAATVDSDIASKSASLAFLGIASPLVTYVSAPDDATRYGLYQPNVLALFTDYQVAYADSRDLRLYRSDGSEDIAWASEQRASLASADYAAFVAELRRAQVVPLVRVQRAAENGRAMLVVGTRIGKAKGERRTPNGAPALGYLVGVFDLRAVEASAQAIGFGESGSAVLTDSQGRPWPRAAGTPEAVPGVVPAEVLDRLGREHGVEEAELAGARRFVTVRSPRPELLVVASMASDEVNRAGSQIAVIVAVLILLSLLAMHRLVFVTVRRVLLAPVQRLIRMARAIAAGNLRTPVPLDGAGELADLGYALRDLASGLAQAQLESAARETARARALDELTAERDRAESASRAKGEFLARMSHEIRTPINGVLGTAELLRDTALDERQRRYVQLMHHSADVLDFSKIEAGKLELDDAPFDLGEVVQDAIGLFAEQAASKGLELVCDLAPAVHTALRGDQLRLRQILINLIGNAIKFTERGEIVVRVEERAQAGATSQLRLEVRDTGIGIKPGSLKCIFESFSQEDGSTTRRFGGTGLGLAISKELVELMGGEIGVASELGAGSTFHFSVTLPREAATAPAPDHADLAGARVLLVDDNATLRTILAARLGSWGVTVCTAESGAQALAVLRRPGAEPVDVILLDQHMPAMDGVAVVHALQSDPGLRELPVIMMGVARAGKPEGDPQRASIAAWLMKPVDAARLRERLRSVLTGRQSETLTSSQVLRALHQNCAVSCRTVLLVEDNPVNQELACAMLGHLGASVVSAWNGREALAALHERRFDLVLLDCQMPDMDGYEVSRRWRAHEAARLEQSRTPIIALTANALAGDEQTCLDAGMDAYLSKPFTVDQLRQMLDACLTAAPIAPAASTASKRASPTLTPARRSSGASSLRRKVIAIYLQSTSLLMQRLAAALATADAKALIEVTSALRSSSLDIGATALIGLCEALEAAARNEDGDTARRLGEDLLDEHRQVVAALNAQYGMTAA